MAATEKGVWDLQEVRDKQLASEWSYSSNSDPGQLWAVGYNANGQLGQNDRTYQSSPVQVGTEATWMQIDGGGFDALGGIKSDGTLWTWGQNLWGKLGLNQGSDPASQKSSPTQVGTNTTWSTYTQAEAFSNGTKTDGTLWGWGVQNHWGNPAGTPAGAKSSPTQIGTGITWALGRGKLAAWTNAAAAISSSGQLYTWNRNYSGSLGQNQSPSANYRDNGPTLVGTDTTWDTISFGKNHAGATKTNSTLWVWGLSNESGCLGLNEGGVVRYSSPVQVPGTTWSNVFAGGNQTLATKTDNTLWAWGFNLSGGLGLNQAPAQLESLSSPTQIPGTSWDKVQLTERGAIVTQIDG